MLFHTILALHGVKLREFHQMPGVTGMTAAWVAIKEKIAWRGKETDMKRDFLKGLDLGDGARLPDDAIDAIMAEHGKTRNALDGQIETLKGQLDEANSKLTGYDPDWKSKADAAQKALEEQKFDFALQSAVSAAKPRNAKAVLALIDREKLVFAGDEIVGLDKQIDALRKGEDTAFLFQDNNPKATSFQHGGGVPVGNSKDRSQAANDAIRAAFGRPT